MRGLDGMQSVLTAVGPNTLDLQSTSRIHILSREPLCGDAEGWGPVSSLRWDFTPCFLDIWIVGVAVWGVLFGVGALWYLFKQRTAQDVPKNWHFYAKLYDTLRMPPLISTFNTNFRTVL